MLEENDSDVEFLTPNMKKSKLEYERTLHERLRQGDPLIWPNAMFANGISLNLNDTSSCQETQIDFSKDLVSCSDNDVECDKIVPDPRHYGLSEHFIFVEQEWGSLFYKHIGKRTRSEAKTLCSTEGPAVHLPIPRFPEEQEFYKTYFADDNLWLDMTYDANEGIKSSNGATFFKFIKTFTHLNDQKGFFENELSQTDEKFAIIKNHEWINLAGGHAGYFSTWEEQDVFMNDVGEWDWTDESDEPRFDESDDVLFDAVCVYDVIPEEKCSKCQNESFCRYKDLSRKETECVCKKTTEGVHCEVDLCANCQNGGYCDFKDATNEIQCICPFPFYGEFCEGKICLSNACIQHYFQIHQFWF